MLPIGSLYTASLEVAPPTVAGPFYLNHRLRKCLQRLQTTGQSNGGIFSIEIPFFQMALACIKLAQDEMRQYAFPRQSALRVLAFLIGLVS